MHVQAVTNHPGSRVDAQCLRHLGGGLQRGRLDRWADTHRSVCIARDGPAEQWVFLRPGGRRCVREQGIEMVVRTPRGGVSSQPRPERCVTLLGRQARHGRQAWRGGRSNIRQAGGCRRLRKELDGVAGEQ